MPMEGHRESLGPEHFIENENYMLSLQEYLKERHEGKEKWKQRSSEIIYQLKD